MKDGSNQNNRPVSSKCGSIFWGIIFILLISAIGQGSLAVNIARYSLIGMITLGIVSNKWPHKISRNLFLSIEILLWLTIIGAGIFFQDGMILVLGIGLFLIVGCVGLGVWLKRKYNIDISPG